MEGCTAGYAYQQSLLLRQTPCSAYGVFVAYGEDFANDFGVIVCRNESCSDALYLVGTSFSATYDGTCLWLYGNGPDVFIICAKSLAYATDCSACANSAYDNIYLAVGVGPNFFGSASS